MEIEAETAPAPVVEEAPREMTLKTAIQDVLRKAIVHDGVVRGLREVVRLLDRRQALLCILAKNCDEPAYRKLVEALCDLREIPLLKVEDNHELGQWVGLCKVDREGNARKVVRCSCVAIKDFGEGSEAYSFLEAHIRREEQ
eukprot:gnl/Trimastix_PCT/115.p2 GENE.gnl/Trimastix_PCT/115~~gnl/Trimastix_PCT/115.p2  ORF type:complete len:142 (+),score=58.64 gnl/Trimastix_PCT/115:60-485(+)